MESDWNGVCLACESESLEITDEAGEPWLRCRECGNHWPASPANVPVEKWGLQSWMTKELLDDGALDVVAVFGQRVKDSALAAGYLPIGEPTVKVFEPDPLAPVPDEWADLPFDRLPRTVRASVKVVRNH